MAPRTFACAIAVAIASTASAQAGSVVVDPPELGPGPDPVCMVDEAPVRAPIDGGRAIASLGDDACFALLNTHRVPHRRLSASDAPGVGAPIVLEGPLEGVEIVGESVIDCRLALALALWAPELRAQGIRRLRHLSIYRPGARVRGSRRVSGHAHALAIDVAAVELDDGTERDVLNGWLGRERGADPCAAGDEPLRRAVCAAIEADLLQIVLTPHHDDAHQNHVHLELVPDVAWSYVR